MCFLKVKQYLTNNPIQLLQSQSLKHFQGTIHDYYDFQQNEDSQNLLGSGTFGYVVKATRKYDDLQVAIKIIKKKSYHKLLGNIQTEDEILIDLKHQNIIKFVERFESDDKIYLVLEYCEGGQVFDRLEKEGKLNEKQTKKLVYQVAKAISYCHSKNLVHRDIKLNNILFLHKKQSSPVKLIDFGCAVKIKQGQKLNKRIGTIFYTAPQVLAGSYDQRCDIWSLGVIIYTLLLGYPPFYGQNEKQIIEMIEESNYTFEMEQSENLSEDAKNLIKGCLTDPQSRLNANQVVQHPWFAGVQDCLKLKKQQSSTSNKQ